MNTEEAVKNIVAYGYFADDIPVQVVKALDMAISALREKRDREKQTVWHKFSEESPTAEKDYCVIRKYHSQGSPLETVKDGEIWVEMDYWNNDPESHWYGWESIGQNNPAWETLYWLDLGRVEVSLPDDVSGKVTRSFGEVVSQENSKGGGIDQIKRDWISVKDRLPKPFESVLVHMPGETPFQTVREGFIASDGVWHAALYDREPGEVTHWMPMPEPPRGVTPSCWANSTG